MNANRAAAVVFTVLAAIVAILLIRLRGPAPVAATAATSEFSAERAVNALHAVFAGDAPHPVGSPQHETVLDRLVKQFAAIGYQPQLHRGFACTADVTCTPTANITADLPGDARAETLLVTAHYDSVPAGPGASDDGVGMASVLEVARALRNEHFRNTIRFLITDAEEAGLIGAEAAAEDGQTLRGARAVINVEDRGTSGPSFMFETSRHNKWLIAIVARALPRPSTSSLFYEAYEMLPNDTDLTVFKRLGLAGLNFAAIGGVTHYHTPLDNLEHVHGSLVQDHGAHLLAMTRALANVDLRQETDDNAVFFDVLSLFVVWWPQRWTMLIAIAILAVLLVGGAMHIRSGQTTAGRIIIGVISFFTSLIAAATFAAVAAWIISLRSPAAIWTAQPGPSIAAAWLIGIACTVALSSLLVSRAEFDGLFIGHAICWAAIGIVLARFLPGVSYIAIVPAAAFALSVILSAIAAADVAIGALICAAVAAVLHFPLALFFYDAFGRPAIIAIALVLALVSTTFSPLVATALLVRRAAVSAMAATALVCILMQLLIAPFTSDSPRRLNVRYVDDGERVEWEADALTAPLRNAGFHLTQIRFPWTPLRSVIAAAPAPRMQLAEPEARVIGREPRHLTIALRSPRGAERISLTFHTSAPAVVRVNGVAPPSETHRHRSSFAAGWRRISLRGAQQATIDLYLQKDEAIEAVVSDYSYGLPPSGAPLVNARNDSTAVPSDDGDGVLIMRRVRL